MSDPRCSYGDWLYAADDDVVEVFGRLVDGSRRYDELARRSGRI